MLRNFGGTLRQRCCETSDPILLTTHRALRIKRTGQLTNDHAAGAFPSMTLFLAARPRASGRGTDAATSSQTLPHLDSKQNPVEPAPALVNRQEGQGQRFHFPSPRHDFTALPHPLARRDLQPPVRNSIGVSVPSNNINSRTAPPLPNSRPNVPETFSVQHGATSRIGSINTRPVAPGGPARGAASLPTTSRTAAISGTGIMRRGIGSPQIGGPAR